MTPKSLIAPARLARRPVLATQTDARLVDLVRAGYEPAFEAIVARYRGALLRYTERFLSRERAEDVVQQSFVRAYEAMLRDDAELSLRPWLYRIAHNAALNTLRDRGLRHEALGEGIDGVERPDQAFERAQALRDVVTAVQSLPERQRDAIVLRELEGRSYEQIATELGVTGGSVRQLLNRARNTLRAGATAVIPLDLLLRIPLAAQSEPMAARVAELCGAAGAGAALTKVGATAAVTATLVGGAVVVPDRIQTDANAPPAAAGKRDRPLRAAAEPEAAPRASVRLEEREPAELVLERRVNDARGGDGSARGSGSGRDDRSHRGPGGGGGDDDAGHRRGRSRHGNSGPGDGGDEHDHAEDEDRDEDRDEDEDEDEAAKLVRDDSRGGGNSGPGGGDKSGSGGGDSSGSGSGGDASGSSSGGDPDPGDPLYESSSESGSSGSSGGSGEPGGSGSSGS